MISNTLWEVDCEEKKRLSIDVKTVGDKLIWHYSRDGDYTVKSGYH